jgi:hypothetical protein
VASPTSPHLAREVFASHDESPPHARSLRLARGVSASPRQVSRTRSLRLRLLARMSSFRLQLRQDPHIRVGAWDTGPTRTWCCPTLELPRDDTQGTSSPHHESASAGDTRGRPALTGVVLLYCSAARPPTRRPVQLYGTPTPSEALKYPQRVGTHLHLGANVAGLIHTKEG